MSRRMSSPKASISELGCSGVNKTLTEAVRTSKRRRKDSTPSTALRCRSTSASKHQSTSAAVAVNQSKHVMGHAAEGKGSGASPGSSSSVVMVHVPSNFSFSQAACRYRALCTTFVTPKDVTVKTWNYSSCAHTIQQFPQLYSSDYDTKTSRPPCKILLLFSTFFFCPDLTDAYTHTAVQIV